MMPIRQALALPACAVVLAACQHYGPRAGGTERAHEPAHPISVDADPDSWLQVRSDLCGLPEAQQRARYDMLSGDDAAGSRMQRLLLATCVPDRTPGLLRETPAAGGAEALGDAGQQHLVELIRDFSASYQILEARVYKLELQVAHKDGELEKTRQELSATVDGIRQIESEIDGLRTGGEHP